MGPETVISIVEQAGISSAAHAEVFGAAMDQKKYDLASFPQKPYWSAATGYYSNVKLVDGGGSDYTGKTL
jgi:uncharacterized protein (DUF2236 family)